jgi:hypothetical protein
MSDITGLPNLMAFMALGAPLAFSMMITCYWSSADTAMIVFDSSTTVVKLPLSTRIDFLVPSNSNLDSLDKVRKWTPLLEQITYSQRFLIFELWIIWYKVIEGGKNWTFLIYGFSSGACGAKDNWRKIPWSQPISTIFLSWTEMPWGRSSSGSLVAALYF